MSRLTPRRSDRVVPSSAGGRPRRGAGARPRRRATARTTWWRRLAGLVLRRHVLAILGVLAVALAAAYEWSSGGIARAYVEGRRAVAAAVADAGLVVREIYVEGRVNAPPELLRAALGIARGDPILAVDPAAARARLEALGWVRAAVVERRLPDRVHVRLAERRPAARWQHEGRVRLIDGAGVLVADRAPSRFAHLPLVVGAGAPRALPELLRAVAGAPEVTARLSAAVRVGGRRWNLRFDDRIDVKLPEQDLAAAWARLVALQRREQVLDRAITVLDLRQDDRVVVRGPAGVPTPPGASAPGRGSDA